MLKSVKLSPTASWFRHFVSPEHRPQLWSWFLFFALFALLCSPNVLFASLVSMAGKLEYLEAIVYGVSFWLLWFAMFPKIWMGLGLALVPAIWLFPSLYLRTTYQTPITSYFYSMFAETDVQELHSFVSVFGLPFVGGTLLCLALIGFGIFVTHKHQISIHRKVRLWLLITLCAAGLTLFVFFNKAAAQSPAAEQKPFADHIHLPWIDKWVAVYPLDLILSAAEYQTERQAIRKLRVQVDQFDFEEKQDSSLAPEIVVLVIGESAQAARWGLYGYERNTTPQLSARNDLIVLKDVVTRSNATRDAVPQMISRRPFIQGDRKPDPLAEPSFVSLFGKLGYATYWLSNQSARGEHDSPIAFYAMEAQHSRYLNPVSYSARGNHDEVLLPVLDDVLAKPGKKLIVLHTLGSHFNYDFRYPDEFKQYSFSDRTSLTRDEKDEKKIAMSNSYDNTTLYTDHFLNNIIRKLDSARAPAVMIYSSDHGEDVMQKGCKLSSPSRLTANSFWIPAFVWANPQAIEKNPTSYVRLKSRASQPMTTSVYFDLLTDLAAVETKGSNFVNWRDANWKTSTRWVYSSASKAVDYDQKKSANLCSIWSDQTGVK